MFFMSITNDFHLWKSDFFENPYIDPYIVYRLSGSEFSLLKNFFYTQTQIIGKFIYKFPKKIWFPFMKIMVWSTWKTTSCLLFFMSIKTTSSLLQNNKQLVIKQQVACYKITSSLLFLQQPFDLCGTPYKSYDYF